MNLVLRLLLIIGSFTAAVSVIQRIRRAKLQIDEAVFWVCFFLALIIIALFPDIIYFLSSLSGTQSPANMLYLIIIAVLIIKIFSISLQISVLNSKITRLIQDEALKHAQIGTDNSVKIHTEDQAVRMLEDDMVSDTETKGNAGSKTEKNMKKADYTDNKNKI